MPMVRTIVCDVCGLEEAETVYGNGFNGWGAFQGIALDGVDNPSLCPQHKAEVANFIDQLKVNLNAMG